jgi:caa(3)-type oxidase subunit IV
MSEHSTKHYVMIWAILLVLLAISVVGPMAEIKILTLVTAFGIAVVKAYLVARNFMHLNIERRYVSYLLVTGIALMVLLFIFIAPDVMKHEGQNWDNKAAKESVKRATEAAETAPAH